MDINGLQINFGLEENGIQRNLTEIKNSFREVNSSVKLTDKLFNKTERTMSEYNDELDKLGRASKILENNLDGLEGEMKSLDTTTAKGKKKMTQLRTEYNKQAMAALRLEHRIDELGDEYDELSNSQKILFSSNSKAVRGFKTLQARIQATNQRINKLGDSFRNFGYVVRGMGMGVLISNLSALVPVGGSAISVLAGLGGTAVAASGGVIGLAGAYGIAYAGIGAFAAQAGTALKMVEDGEMRATAELNKYQTSLTGLQNQWKGLVQNNQADIFNTMSNGINMARHALTQLTPFITKTTSQISQFSRRMLEWVQSSKNATGAFNMLNQVGPPIFQNILNSIFKVTDGLVHMGTQFAPLFTWVGQGLENMANKFNVWANSASTDNGITRFIEYVKINLPLAGQIFGNIFMGIISLFQAFSGHSHTVMQGMVGVTNTFKEWAANLSGTEQFKNFIGYLNENGPKVWQVLKNIGTILVSVIQGMAPIGAFVLDMTLKFTDFIAKITEGNKILGGFIGILSMIVGASMALYPAFSVLGNIFGPLVGWFFKLVTSGKLLTGILTGIRTAFSLFTGPVGILVMLGTALTVAYQKSEVFRDIVNNVIISVKNGFISLWNTIKMLFNGILLLWQGDFVSAEVILNKILPPSVVGFIRTAVSTIRTLIIQVITAVRDFGLQIGAQIMAFWQANGPMIMQAVQNIGNVIKTVFQAIWSVVKPILTALGTAISWTFNTIIVPVVKTAMNIILGIMKLIWPVIKWLIVDTWNAIKGTIQGALNIIMGTIKVFSALFTGNWGAMWSGIKQVASGVLNMVWGLIQLVFIGKILKVVRLFGGLLKSILSGAWGVVKRIFSSSGNFIWGIVKRIFTSIKNFIMNIFNGVKSITSSAWNFIYTKISGFVRSILNSVRSRFNSLKNSTISIFNSVRNFLYGLWTAVRNKVVSLAQSLWNGVRSKFNSLKSSIKSIFNSVRNFLYDIWNKVRNKVVSIATSLWNGVRNKFNDLKNSVKGIIGKVRDNLYSVWDKIWNKVTGVATSLKDKVVNTFGKLRDGLEGIIGKIKGFIDDMVEKVKKGLNKLIGGVNKVGEKLGMGKEMVKPIKLSTGTESTHSQNFVSNGAISKPTMAVVNDKGPGNGSGPNGHQELIQRKNGSLFAPQGRNTLVGLNKGDKVINGRDTQRAQKQGLVPKFSKGTGSLPRFSEGTGVFDWIGDKLGDIWDYAKDPSKLLDKIIEKMGINFDFLGKDTIPGGLMQGMFKKIKKGAANLIKSWFEAQEGGDGGVLDMSKLSYRYGNDPNYKRETGLSWHSGLDFSYINEPLPSTINGTANVMPNMPSGYGKWVKIVKGAMEVIYAHLSKHTLKDGQKVKIGDTVGISGNTGFSTGPHLHYEMRRNGEAFDPLPWLKKNNGGGSKKKPSQWATAIDRAAKRMKVNLSKSEKDGIIAQIKRESNGDAGVTQSSALRDINVLSGNPAQGLLQYVPATFKSYAMKGHTNIKSGYDQLLAFFNNKNWRKDLAYGKSGWGPSGARRFATGGIINSEGMYNLAEDGHSEVVVPLDPARANDAMKLIGYAQSKIKDKKNKRPNDISNRYSSQSSDDNTNLLLQMIANQQKQLDALMEIARSNKHIEEQPKGFNTDDVSQGLGRKARMQGFNYGM